MELVLLVLRYAWPWLLAATIYGVQEARILALNSSLATSHKRELAAQSLLDEAHQRASDLALLYADTLPKIGDAARKQEANDHAEMATLQARIDTLSRVPTLHFSGLAVGLLDSINAFANRGDAAPAAEPATGPATVPQAPAAPASAGGYYSEADIVEHDKAAATAYRDAVGMFHECRATYNAARAAQLQVNTKGATP